MAADPAFGLALGQGLRRFSRLVSAGTLDLTAASLPLLPSLLENIVKTG